MLVDVRLECPVYDSFRVQQIAGMFDLPPSQVLKQQFQAEVPGPEQAWEIGCIVGPSGSGKTSLARQVYKEALQPEPAWPNNQAVIDGFGPGPLKPLVRLLTAVGFSSPPSWLRPYRVLSGGQQFRCNLARSLWSACPALQSQTQNQTQTQSPVSSDRPVSVSATHPLVVCDEFTSSVDRRVAQNASLSLSKAIRQQHVPVRFVAVTCHHDIVPWLSPDWVLDLGAGELKWRCLRRPRLKFQLCRVSREVWSQFAEHHYLSRELGRGVRCYAACVAGAESADSEGAIQPASTSWSDTDGEPAAFCAVLPAIGQRERWRISRLVTLPQWQGIGLGMRLAEAVAERYQRDGKRMNLTTSHPAAVAHCTRSHQWQLVGLAPYGRGVARSLTGNYRGSPGRAVVSFEFLGSDRSPQKSVKG